MKLGKVPTFEDARCDEEQGRKVLEEAAEVYGALQDYLLDRDMDSLFARWALDDLKAECCDLIQAVCNLLAGAGVSDITDGIKATRKKNEERGWRYGDER